MQKLFSSFFRWWLAELATFVPKRVLELWTSTQKRAFIELNASTLSISDPTAEPANTTEFFDCSAGNIENNRLIVTQYMNAKNLTEAQLYAVISSEDVLFKSISLPSAARADLRNVIYFEMEKYTPFSQEDVCFDFKVKNSPAWSEEIEIDLAVAPRSRVDALVSRLAELGLPPARVVASAPGQSWDNGFCFLGMAQKAKRRVYRRLLPAVLGAMSAVLVGLAVYLPIERTRGEAATLAMDLSILREQAKTASDLQAEIDELTGAQDFITDKKRMRPSITGILSDITRLLPDDTWLFELRINDMEIGLQGFSPAAQELIGLIEREPQFQKASFRSRLTRETKGNRERFHIIFEAGAPPS